MVQRIISGAFAKVLYEFETSYGVPYGGKYTAEGAMNMTRVLGHGIKVSTYSKDNTLKPISGINNIEATAIIDGPFQGKLSLEFDAIADISWMKALMGREKALTSTTKQYAKDIVPPSMTFVIYFNNDSDDPFAGQAWMLTGVVCTSAKMSIEAGDTPLHVSIDCEYQTEKKLDGVTQIPTVNAPADQPFNYAMARALFWNPDIDTNGPASFDSIECIIDKVNFSVKHNATLQKGISSRIALDAWYAGIEYELSMSAVFKDSKKFLERFYGCKDTPSKYIAPYEQISLVFENYFRDQRHAKLQFDFKTVKIKTISQPVAIDNVIMEDITFLPIKCDIYSIRGAPGVPEFNVSPSTVEQGRNFYVWGENFVPGEQITVSATFLDGGSLITNANCLGELRYACAIPSSQAAGLYTVSCYSDTSIPSGTPSVFNVAVISPGQNMASISSDTNVFALSSTPFSITGYNFGAGDVTIYLEKYNEATKVWATDGSWSASIAAASLTNGMFSYSASSNPITLPARGKYRFKAVSSNGIAVAYYTIYAPELTTAALSNSNKTLTVIGMCFPPNLTINLTYIDGSTVIPVGTHQISYNGYMPGPTGTDSIVYTRSTAFTDSNAYVRGVVAGVNGGTFTLTKTV